MTPLYRRVRAMQREYRRRLWEAALRPARQWRDACRRRACPDCGGRPCQCDGPPSDEILQSLLRRLAGLNPASGGWPGPGEWGGPRPVGATGPQKCGPATWDDVVRLMEDG